MSKKILSLALVVVMLFSTLAISSSAALSSGQVGLRLETNATVGMPAGSSVWVKLYIDVPEGETVNFAFNNLTIAWNSAVYTPDCTNQTKVNDSITMGDSYADIFKGTDAANHTTTAGANAIKNLTTEESSYGWNKAVQFQLATLTGTYTSTTGFPVDSSYSEVLTMKFVTNDVLDASDVIGFPMSDYGSTRIRLQTMTPNDTSTKALVDAANVVVTNAVPVAPSYDVYKLSAPRKHSNGDGTNTVAVFYAFDTSAIDPNFITGSANENENGRSQFISAIAATITAKSGDQSITVTPDPIKYVYKIDADTYGFRVILKNVPDAADITVVPSVTTTDSATYNVETVSFNVADATAA